MWWLYLSWALKEAYFLLLVRAIHKIQTLNDPNSAEDKYSDVLCCLNVLNVVTVYFNMCHNKNVLRERKNLLSKEGGNFAYLQITKYNLNFYWMFYLFLFGFTHDKMCKQFFPFQINWRLCTLFNSIEYVTKINFLFLHCNEYILRKTTFIEHRFL